MKENEVQLMLNRIALFEGEEEKIKRKILKTRKQASILIANKEAND